MVSVISKRPAARKVDHIIKVGKNNFRPSPQVKSSVVRIVPIDPPPPMKFDGLNRILFSRRNKMTNACFPAKGVLEMLESNWRTWCSENDQVRLLLCRIYFSVLAYIPDHPRRRGNEGDGRRGIGGNRVRGAASGQDECRQFTQVRLHLQDSPFQ